MKSSPRNLAGVLVSVTATSTIAAVRRTVDENSRTLKFEQHGFEDA